MKKWYCDRCGNEIDFENRGCLTTKDHRYGSILFFFNKKHIVDEREVELCNDCMLSYFRWFLNNGKEEINNHVTSAIKEDIMKLESKEDDS